uniref:Galactosyltransferase C-terminal domain-containing protein n=1 Tax=Equus caballus TaxID=9796 RepID=A0A9L0TB54_HORSE
RNSTGYRLRYKQFFEVKGFSNNYWGWGGEDDDLRLRVELHRMKIIRPMPEVSKYTMIFHTRDQGNEVNTERMKLLHQVLRVWRTDGLTSCVYKLLCVDYNPLYINITVDFWSGDGHRSGEKGEESRCSELGDEGVAGRQCQMERQPLSRWLLLLLLLLLCSGCHVPSTPSRSNPAEDTLSTSFLSNFVK